MSDVAVVTASYFPGKVGGGERAARWILNEFNTITPIIYTFGDKEREYIHNSCKVKQFKHPPLGDSYVRAGVFSLRMVEELKSCELIYCHGMSGPHAITAAIASLVGGADLVYHTHSSFMGTESARHKLILKQIMQAESRVADRIFCVSSLEKEKLVSKGYIPGTKYKTIRNGVKRMEVDKSRFKQWAEKQLNLTKNYVLSVGDVTPTKGQLEAIRAFSEVDKYLEYVIIGDVKESPMEIARSYGVNNQIHLTGPLDHELTRSAMAGAECLIHLSEWESYGLVIAESIAEGTPVIISDNCGAMSEVETGENGYISEQPHSPKRIAKYIEETTELSPSPEIRTWNQVSQDVESELIAVMSG